MRDPKNRETRRVPMNQSLKEALSSHRLMQAHEAGGIVRQVFIN